MTRTSPVNMQAECPDILTAFGQIEQTLSERDIAPGLRHLVKLRASQMNECAFCVKMHANEARRDGETSQRIDRLTVWRQCDDYTPAEKAALSWAEALTCLPADSQLAEMRSTLRNYYSDNQIASLTAIIAMINLWNRIGISQH